MIDKAILEKQIHKEADRLLVDCHLMFEDELKDNLRHFANKAKDIAEILLEEYIFSIVERYTSSEFAITDQETLSAFVDLNTGYQQQMLDWIKAHPLEIKEEILECPRRKDFVQEPSTISPKVVLGAGTGVSIGLLFFSKAWIALVAEVLALVIAKIQKNKRDKERQIAIVVEQKQYEMELNAKKKLLVDLIIRELETWIDLGEKESTSVLQKLNLR